MIYVTRDENGELCEGLLGSDYVKYGTRGSISAKGDLAELDIQLAAAET